MGWNEAEVEEGEGRCFHSVKAVLRDFKTRKHCEHQRNILIPLGLLIFYQNTLFLLRGLRTKHL